MWNIINGAISIEPSSWNCISETVPIHMYYSGVPDSNGCGYSLVSGGYTFIHGGKPWGNLPSRYRPGLYTATENSYDTLPGIVFSIFLWRTTL